MPPEQPASSPRQAPWSGKILTALRYHYLTVDVRWLGIFRILLGSLLCVEVLRRWYYARPFYTNDGVLPNHFSMFAPMGRDVFSIYHAFSTYPEVSAAFLITLLVFLCFTLGWKTKWMHVLSAVCITSLNSRNLFIENGGTVVVNVLTVWTLFLPLGRRFSIDALWRSLRDRSEKTSTQLNDRERPSDAELSHVSLVVLALILQWSAIYFLNAIQKSGVGWKNGTALHWFWHQDRIATDLAIFAREHAPLWLISALTAGTLVVERLLGMILLVPYWRDTLRRLAFLLSLGLHAGIALSSRLGPFSYVMPMFYVLLLGPEDWALAARWFGRESRKLTVVYDSDCGICLLICRILKRLDPFERLTFVGNVERDKLPAALDDELLSRTVAVIDARGRVSTEAEAVYRIGKALPFGILATFWLRLPGLSALGTLLYRRIADNRMHISAWLGLGVCGLGSAAASEATGAAASGDPPLFGPRARRSAVALRELGVVVLAYALFTQLVVENPFLSRRIKLEQPEWAASVVSYPRIYQGWKMFAPEPPYEDGRIVVDGRTKDGRKLDPLTGDEPVFDPTSKRGWGHEQFWCDYQVRIGWSNNDKHKEFFENYLRNVHKYGGRPNDELVAFDVWWIRDRSPPPTEQKGSVLPPRRVMSFGFVKDSGAAQPLPAAASR